jgi:hypothetical protein
MVEATTLKEKDPHDQEDENNKKEMKIMCTIFP